ncbi:hypothetical protein G5V58_16815 [Nocardioides anomalus]|uniref:PH domain-containing protein n=1 Tax=Nocardioides anomalus TaxID=2712223 RepID=A0A6G6WG52_9ACTN|nr:hypothetical protein [Nocardioides anomalus]QIG44214.1 hypothetical protein G5V58_16815 [Nocardioides anomalus]
MLTGGVVVATAVLTGLLLWLEHTAALAASLGFLVLWAVLAGAYVLAWLRMRAVASPLGLHGDGVVSRSPYGELVVPWESVESARVEGPLLRIRIRPGAPVDHTRLRPAAWPVVEANGIRITLAALDVPLEELRQAFTVQSSGRVQVA